MKPRSLAPALVAVLALAGCGGSSGDGDDKTGRQATKSDRSKGAPALGAGRATPAKASLLSDGGATASAGESDSYEPSGEIIADSGFRPGTDGFGFENYGNDVEPENLTTAEVHSLFGDQVCVGGDGESCRLIPPAQRWLENENARMDGGHCMGMSVAAIRMFIDKLSPSDFGASTTSALEIQENTDLQSSIAEHWVYQDLPRIQARTVNGTPTAVLDRLIDALNSGKEDYTIGIFKADGSGGHAITPFAVEDQGDGAYAVLAYDNNFPGVVRALSVDANEDTWRYVGGTNPKDLGQVYEGDASSKSMMLLPTSPGEQEQPCPFCAGEEAGEGEELGSTLPKAKQYTEVTLSGSPTNHPHLVLEDDQERRTGIVDGKLLQEIPGVKVVQGLSVRNWDSAPEPRFQVPAGRDITMTIDGTHLKRKAKANIDIVGNGLVIAIDEIVQKPGQQDVVSISGGGYGLYYVPGGTDDVTPELYAGVEDGDDSYTFAAAAAGLKPGSTVGLLVDRESKTVVLDGDGSKSAAGDTGFFALAISRETADAERVWGTDLELNVKRKESAVFSYAKTPKAGRPVDIEVGPDNGASRTVRAPYMP